MNQQPVIILHVQRAEDILFKSAIPFSDKRLLNPDADEFLIEEAEDLPVKNDITLFIHAEEKDPASEEAIVEAIHKHFAYRSRKVETQIKNILKLGWKSLLVSFVFLVFMFFIAKAITTFLPENALMITFRELFIILGWVALWRPADLLLYEWRSYKRKAKLLARLAHCKVEFQ